MNRMMDFFGDFVLPLFVVIAAVFSLGIIVWLGYLLFNPGETISLTKANWECTAKERRSSTTYVKSGAVLIPITNHYNHCTQWSER